MLPWDPQGKEGPKNPLPDNVTILDPKNEDTYNIVPSSEEFQKPEEVVAHEVESKSAKMRKE
jgi:small subunit ribosomal protein S3e